MHYCAVLNCVNNSGRTNQSFFCFPKDVERATYWAIACGREDLVKDAAKLYKRSRVCGLHFQTSMFLNDLKNRLQPRAHPTIFPSRKVSPSDHTYCVFIPNKEEGREYELEEVSLDIESVVVKTEINDVAEEIDNIIEEEINNEDLKCKLDVLYELLSSKKLTPEIKIRFKKMIDNIIDEIAKQD